MKYDAQLGNLKEILTGVRRMLVVLPTQVTNDDLAAGLALYLSLQQAQKEVAIVTEATPLVAHSNLYGIGDVKSELPPSGSGNFVIKLENVVSPDGKVHAEKVDYYPEGSNLNLVFHITSGQRFEPTNITSHHETGFNLIMVVGATTLQELGISQQAIQPNASATVVNIDNTSANTNFGTINVVDPSSSSISEMMIQILSALGLPLDSDIASNIVAGIYDVTRHMTVNVSADSFLAVGQAMQAGAQIPATSSVPTQPPVVPSTPPQSQTSPQGFDLREVFNIPQAIQQEGFTNPPVVAQTNQVSITQEEKPQGEYAVSNSPETDNPPPDWLTPKILKGGSMG